MKGSVGTTTSIYHTRLPRQWKLERMCGENLSREARRRLRWMDHYRRCGNASLTCRYYGISRTTFYKWWRRFKKRGLPGLEELSRAPKRRRESAIPWEAVELVVNLRREYPAWSRHKIAVILKRDHGISLSSSSVGRILKRKGLYEERQAKKRRAAARRRAKRRRAERLLRDLYPGSLIQVDTKRLCVFGTTYYQFTAVDSFSRLSFIRIFGSSSSRSGRRFLEELRDFLPFRIHAVQTDNGSEYLKEFEKELQEAGVDHYFTYPRCPQQNARVERKIQSSQYEYWDHRLWGKDLEELNHMADEWNYIYNHVRPHQSLGYLTPAEFLRQWQEERQRRDKVFTM